MILCAFLDGFSGFAFLKLQQAQIAALLSHGRIFGTEEENNGFFLFFCWSRI